MLEGENEMASGARYVYLALAWLFLAGIVVQVFLAGMGLFSVQHDFEPHIGLGWLLHIGPVLLLIAAAIAQVGRRIIWWNVALLLAVGVQPFLPAMKKEVPFAAALHPVNALIIFWLTLTIGLMAWRLVRQPAPASA